MPLYLYESVYLFPFPNSIIIMQSTTTCATCGATIYQSDGKSECKREECPVRITYPDPDQNLFRNQVKTNEEDANQDNQ